MELEAPLALEASRLVLRAIRAKATLPAAEEAGGYVDVSRMADCLDPAGDVMTDGVAIHEDGRVFVACCVDFPRCTAADVAWWFQRGCGGDAEYRLWHPGDHVSGHFSAGWYARDDAASPQGETHFVVEALGADLGGKAQTLRIRFRPPEDYGVTATARAKHGADVALCARVGVWDLLAGGWLDVGHFIHFTRPSPTGGVTVHSRFWLGDIQVPRDNYLLLPVLPLGERLLNTRFARNAAAKLIEGRTLFQLGLANYRHATEEFAVLATFLAEARKAHESKSL